MSSLYGVIELWMNWLRNNSPLFMSDENREALTAHRALKYNNSLREL